MNPQRIGEQTDRLIHPPRLAQRARSEKSSVHISRIALEQRPVGTQRFRVAAAASSLFGGGAQCSVPQRLADRCGAEHGGRTRCTANRRSRAAFAQICLDCELQRAATLLVQLATGFPEPPRGTSLQGVECLQGSMWLAQFEVGERQTPQSLRISRLEQQRGREVVAGEIRRAEGQRSLSSVELRAERGYDCPRGRTGRQGQESDAGEGAPLRPRSFAEGPGHGAQDAPSAEATHPRDSQEFAPRWRVVR